MFHDRNERCFGKKTTKRSQYSFWIRPQHENMNSKWFYYWSHAHQNQADWETLWPNLQLLSLVLLNVMWWYAAKRPGYFFYLESYKSNENGLGFTNLLIFVLSLYDLSEPRTLGWPLPRVTSFLHRDGAGILHSDGGASLSRKWPWGLWSEELSSWCYL